MYQPPPRRRGRKAGGPPTDPPRRSDVAAYAAVIVVMVGLYLGTYTVLAPALLGFFLLATVGSFLSARINPFSIGFYLTTKPSWTAIGVVLLSSLTLLATAYYYLVHGIGPILPTLHPRGH